MISGVGSLVPSGIADTGVGKSVNSFVSLAPNLTLIRDRGAQASAGRNCKARGPSQRHSPCVLGDKVTYFSALSSTLFDEAPMSLVKRQ